MNNIEKLKNVFVTILEIDLSLVNDDLKYQSIAQWDSINQMFLISEIENVFEVEIDSDDVLEIDSFTHAKEILGKYEIKF